MFKKFLIAFLAGATVFALTGCTDSGGGSSNPPSGGGNEENKDVEPFNGTLQGNSQGNSQVEAGGAAVLSPGDTYAVIRIRGFGEIKLALFPDIAPLAVNNFVDLSQNGYYNSKIFHRIITDFMIQGGSPFGDGRGDSSYPTFVTEPSPLATHLYGAISTANSGPGTNGQQFFIVNKSEGTPHLEGNHTVFGQMVDGFEVLEAVSAVQTAGSNRPINEVVIENVTIHTYTG
jgi:cyclophilin family peptidyl-prolyl cis-trans isomerase